MTSEGRFSAAPLRRRCLALARELGVRLRWRRGWDGCAWNGRTLYARDPGQWYGQHSLLHDLCHHQCASPERRVGYPEWGLGSDPTSCFSSTHTPTLLTWGARKMEESWASLMTVLWLREWGMRREALYVWQDHYWEGLPSDAAGIARHLVELGLVERGGRGLVPVARLRETHDDTLSLLPQVGPKG